jgi:hypothetical protein
MDYSNIPANDLNIESMIYQLRAIISEHEILVPCHPKGC